MTISNREVSRSTSFPFASSPHWRPITHVPGTGAPCCKCSEPCSKTGKLPIVGMEHQNGQCVESGQGVGCYLQAAKMGLCAPNARSQKRGIPALFGEAHHPYSVPATHEIRQVAVPPAGARVHGLV